MCIMNDIILFLFALILLGAFLSMIVSIVWQYKCIKLRKHMRKNEMKKLEGLGFGKFRLFGLMHFSIPAEWRFQKFLVSPKKWGDLEHPETLGMLRVTRILYRANLYIFIFIVLCIAGLIVCGAIKE